MCGSDPVRRPSRGSHTRTRAGAGATILAVERSSPIVSGLCGAASSAGVMNGRGRPSGSRLGSGRHFYETKIQMGDPAEAGKRTNRSASKAVCGENGRISLLELII